MFEKEAEKHADGIYHYKINVSDYGEDGIINYRYSDVKEAYQKGAKFGYNKANEWHYVKDGDLPKNDNNVLVLLKDETTQVDYYFPKIGWNLSLNADVIAWKEIVLPEQEESK